MTPTQIQNIVEDLAHPTALQIMTVIGIEASQGNPHYWPIRREVTIALRTALQRHLAPTPSKDAPAD